MASKKKKIKASGRFGAGYGKVRERLSAIESFQRKRQTCPFCHGRVRRQAKGIWLCTKCNKNFTGDTYHLQ